MRERTLRGMWTSLEQRENCRLQMSSMDLAMREDIEGNISFREDEKRKTKERVERDRESLRDRQRDRHTHRGGEKSQSHEKK